MSRLMNDGMTEYQLIRSRRKTISLSFDSACCLIVKAPVWMTQKQIEAFLEEKAEWIENTGIRLRNAKKEEEKTRLALENGDELYFLGEKRILSVIREERKHARVVCAMGRLFLYVPYDADYEMKRKQLEKWYRKEAAELLNEKADEFAASLQVSYAEIRIKDQKSRWGSCSSKGNLNFNWRILMAPEPVCDYVVIHELCHLVYMDHSENFWKLVEKFCPAYREYRKWLKENGKRLYPF